MTRYVCSWCGRKQDGVNLAKCGECPGPLEPCDLLRDQQRRAREALRKAAAWHPVPEVPPVAPLNQVAPGPLPPPKPRKPRPLKKKD